MSVRDIARLTLVAALPEGAEIPADKWYGSGAVLDTPEPPFAELRFGGTFPGVGRVKRRRLEVWIHDVEGDYGLIEKWIEFVKDTYAAAEQVKGADGSEVQQFEWMNDSTDLYDDGYRTNCMMTAFDVIGKEAP